MQNYNVSDGNSTFHASPHKLIIAEKPSVSKALCPVVGATRNKTGYSEGGGYIVSWCYGRLARLKEPDEYGEKWSGKWSFSQLPMIPQDFGFKITDSTREQFVILKELMNHTKRTNKHLQKALNSLLPFCNYLYREHIIKIFGRIKRNNCLFLS